MTNLIKKIQFNGYTKRPYREVRNEVARVFESEDRDAYVKLKSTNKCAHNKVPHHYVVEEVRSYKLGGVQHMYTKKKCGGCGKIKIS